VSRDAQPDAGDGCTRQSVLVVNGSFDDAPIGAGWEASHDTMVVAAPEAPSQPNVALFGDPAFAVETLTSSPFLIPADATSVVFSFLSKTQSDVESINILRLHLVGDGIIRNLTSVSSAQAQWVARTKEITPSRGSTTDMFFFGKSVRLRFESRNASLQALALWAIDSITVDITTCE